MHRILFFLPLLFLTTACQTTDPVQRRFTRADTDMDSRLSRSELSDFAMRNVFDARDLNNDGELTPVEWWPGDDAAQRALFNQRDANQDGIVTLAEALAWGRGNPNWDQILNAADLDGDAFVTLAELRTYLASKEGPVR